MDTTDLIEIPTGIPLRLTKKYTQHFETFESWCAGHRAHQVASVQACQGQQRGQISLPTGTGKTRVQIHLHVESMIEGTKRGEFGAYVIASHRLALNAQLLDEMTKVLVDAGVPIDLFFIGSDRYTETYVYDRFKNKYVDADTMSVRWGTAKEMVENAYKSAMSKNRHLVCVSTYHSFAALSGLPSIALCTYDEAHTLLAKDFSDNVEKVKEKIQRNFFFTATRRVRGAEEGMNNREFFGEVLHDASPRAMIDVGEIVPPKFHLLLPTEEGNFSNYTMMVKSVLSAFERHKEHVKHFSKDSEKIGAKLLVTVTGNERLFDIHDNEEFREYTRHQNISVFAFSSERGCYVNFEEQQRSEVVRTMKALPDNADAILLHIDILTEGIDLPTITGVMPFRELGEVKLLQTIGRAARLFPDDRTRLYNGELHPGDYAEFVKPYCWILLPEFMSSIEDADALKKVLPAIFNTYKVPIEDILRIGDFEGPINEDANRITKRDKSAHTRDQVCDIQHVIQDILHAKVDKKRLKETVSDDHDED